MTILYTSQLHLTSALILLHICDSQGFSSQGRLMLPQPGKLCPQLPHRSWVFHFLILIYCGQGSMSQSFREPLNGSCSSPLWAGESACRGLCGPPPFQSVSRSRHWCDCFLAVLLKAQVQKKGTFVFLCHYPRVCTRLAYRRCSTERRFGALLPGSPEHPRY